MVRLVPLCLALLGAFGEHSPPHIGATCDEEPQEEFSTLQVASKLQSIAADEVQKRDDTKRMKKEDEEDEDEEGEDKEDEVGEDEDEEDVEAVAALQTAKSSGARRRREGAGRRREGWLGGVKLQPSHGRRRLRRRVAALQTESRQENPDLQDDVIFLDEIEDNFADYMYALREFQANRELLTRQDKQAMVNELRQWAVAEADEMIKLGDLVAVNEAELEGEEDADEAAGEEDDEEADHNEDHEEIAGEEESKSDQETTLDVPALTSVNQPDGNLLQTDVVAHQHRRRGGSNDRRRWTRRRRLGTHKGNDHYLHRRRRGRPNGV